MPTLHWLTRVQDIQAANEVPYRLLEEVSDLSYGDQNTRNMLIQGDNLDALKALLPYFSGEVQCIYIDPPFNTGQAFEHYNDNLEHSIWLGMMYPQLYLLRELLAEEGTIAVHLDDEELAYCTVVMDEIFGRKNRVSLCTFKQSSVSGPKSINPGVVSICSYVMLYAKDKSRWKNNRVYRARERDSRYGKFILNRNDEISEWQAVSLTQALERHYEMPLKDVKARLNTRYEEQVHRFVLDNKESVIRTARVKPKDIQEAARPYLQKSVDEPGTFFMFERPGQSDQYFLNGEQVAFYSSKVSNIDGEDVTSERVSDLWDDLLSNNLHNEGGVKFPKGKKPESLVKRVFEMFSEEGDIVLDSFLGSGTSAAVAHKMRRKYLGIEIGEHAISHCQPRLAAVVDGDSSGISKALNWQGGGGFRFYRLGAKAFDEDGRICSDVRFPVLAAHVWFSETNTPWRELDKSPVLGIHENTAYALLYDGILGDKSVGGGNVLTSVTLRAIRDELRKRDKTFNGPLVVYGEASRIGEARLKRERIAFKQTPYDVKAR